MLVPAMARCYFYTYFYILYKERDMMSYCIYLRKSRKDLEAEQHGDGETLARHDLP